MHRILTILILSLLSLPYAQAKTQLYNMEDLSILHEQKSYKEFLDHFLDIRPSKRNKLWHKMSTDVADEYVKSLIDRDSISSDSFHFIESLATKPGLKNHEFFQLRRTQYALEYFKNCFHLKSCFNQFKDFYTTSKKFEDYDYSFYNLFRVPWPDSKKLLLRRLSLSSASKFYCNKKSISEDLKIILYNQKENLKKSGISKIANLDCLRSLKEEVMKDMITKSDPHMNQYLFKLFSSYDLISKDEEDRLLIAFLLNGPIKGDVLNMAWNRIEHLSQNYKRRSRLLKSLLQLDPLLGKIFSKENRKSKLVFIKHLYRHFPEYLTSYAKTCVSYLDGSKSFPFGNPTIHCDELMAITKNKPWVTDQIKIQYSSSKKFK